MLTAGKKNDLYIRGRVNSKYSVPNTMTEKKPNERDRSQKQ